jgi:hypothetical protein
METVMPKRPSLNDNSFLSHLFGPKRNPQPTGLRKVTLTGIRGGRTRGRLAAFNRMNPVSQEALKRAGLREQYLRGEVALGDAKKSLRQKAVQLGVARPIKPKPLKYTIRTSLDARIAAHLKTEVRAAGKPLNEQSVDINVRLVPDDITTDVVTWDYAQIKHAGRKGSEYETVIDGHQRNPFWYH